MHRVHVMFESNSRAILLCKSDYKFLCGLNDKSQSRQTTPQDGFNKLRSATVVEDKLYPRDVVRIGSTVGLKDLGSGSVAKFVLTDSTTKSAASGAVTVPVGSSLGLAMLGMRRGEEIKWTLPTGHTRYLRISEVSVVPSTTPQKKSCAAR